MPTNEERAERAAGVLAFYKEGYEPKRYKRFVELGWLPADFDFVAYATSFGVEFDPSHLK